MVDRFERNKLYTNSIVANRIVKCEFISNRGSALLTHVCKHPEYTGDALLFRGTDDILSSSPENWDEFTLPETPSETKWVVTFISARGLRSVLDGIHHTEETAIDFIRRRPINDDVRVTRDYKVHPIIVSQTMTLEQFVRSVEDMEETV